MLGGRIEWRLIRDRIAATVKLQKVSDSSFFVPLCVGIRVADGGMAVKIRSTLHFDAVLKDLRTMAVKLEVPDRDLIWLEKARMEASRGEWSQAFMSLGFMQKKILDDFKEAEEDQRSLVMLSGWIQGLRYSATAVFDNYDAAVGRNSVASHPSYQLRDPKLVAWLIELVKKLSPEKQTLPEIIAIRTALEQIYDIVKIDIDPKKGRISKEDVQKLAFLAEGVVAALVAKTQ